MRGAGVFLLSVVCVDQTDGNPIASKQASSSFTSLFGVPIEVAGHRYCYISVINSIITNVSLIYFPCRLVHWCWQSRFLWCIFLM